MKTYYFFSQILFSLLITAYIHSFDKMSQIETIIREEMAKGQVPGLSVVIIKDGKIISQKGYGHAIVKGGVPVTQETLFECGSTTKAFTGLAILKLAEEGKINLNNPLSHYLPWFFAVYRGQKTPIQIKDCLFHTSGIPFQTLATIPQSADDQALEKTVRNINGLRLAHQPSHHFEYATINYDILGLVIQVVTHQPYEEYISKEILQPLGLTQSYLNREIAYQQPKMAQGYKIEYLSAKPFVAPYFRGNTPAGYLISNIEDIGKWLLHQLNGKTFKNAILHSHEPNILTPIFSENSFYAAGWFVFLTEKGTILSHPGNNPNFSSYFAFSPEHQAAVGVLANINSNASMHIGQSIISFLVGQEPEKNMPDLLQRIDGISVIVLLFSILMIMIELYSFIRLWKEIAGGQRKFSSVFRLMTLAVTFALLACLTILLFKLPDFFITSFNWETITIWGPHSLWAAVNMLYVMISLCIIYIQFRILFPKFRNNLI